MKPPFHFNNRVFVYKVALWKAISLARPYFRPPARGVFPTRSVGRPPSRGAELSAYSHIPDAHTPGHRTRTFHIFYVHNAHSVSQISLTSTTKGCSYIQNKNTYIQSWFLIRIVLINVVHSLLLHYHGNARD